TFRAEQTGTPSVSPRQFAAASKTSHARGIAAATSRYGGESTRWAHRQFIPAARAGPPNDSCGDKTGKQGALREVFCGGVRDMTEMRVVASPAFLNEKWNPYNALLYRHLQKLGVHVDEFFSTRILFG